MASGAHRKHRGASAGVRIRPPGARRGSTGTRLIDCAIVTARRLPWWPAPVLAALSLLALYAGALRCGFLNDDYLFLEEARTRSLFESLTRLGALGNFYRPLSRQIYFALLTPVAGGNPLAFHLANAALWLFGLALLLDLLLALVAPAAAIAGVLYFALLPFQRVNLTWISCSQDLLALVASLSAVALYRRGHRGRAALATLAAVASKEVALPLPFVLAAWDHWIARGTPRAILARLWPSAAVVGAWCVVLVVVRAQNPEAAAFLRFGPGDFGAGLAHGAQSLLGLDHPGGIARGLADHGPAPIPLLLLAALAIWMPATRGGDPPHASPPPAPAPHAPPPPAPDRAAGNERATRVVQSHARPNAPVRNAARFAGAWLIAFGLVTGPVAHSWSAYYYTLAAVGGAVLVALACRAIDRWLWLGLTAGLLWWHAGSTATRAFALADRPWVWTSHLTSFYFERGAALSDTLARQLRTLDPSPPAGTRFFFATLPSWAGFQRGNGPLVRTLYRDPSLGSYFFSQYSESTAADHPVRFLFWNGAGLEPLYDRARDPLFQIGSDLLLLGRPSGAAHAFRRGLASGGNPLDHLYWLGWAELWRGDRGAAEAAWRAWGASDDSLMWFRQLRQAETALHDDRDTLETRRLLMGAIRAGIGRPEAHAVLATLLERERPKYAALETMVAVWLKPGDWLARRELVRELAAARLDDRAGEELRALDRIDPGARLDPAIAAVRDALERRGGGRAGVIEF